MVANGISSSSPMVTAASALRTLWRPGAGSMTSPSGSLSRSTWKRVTGPSWRTCSARIVACRLSPYVTTRRPIWRITSRTVGLSRQRMAAPKNGTELANSVKAPLMSSMPS